MTFYQISLFLVSGVTFGETDHNLTILYMENILYQYACETTLLTGYERSLLCHGYAMRLHELGRHSKGVGELAVGRIEYKQSHGISKIDESLE